MHEPPPLTPASEIPAALGPLAHSHTATDLEEAAQSIFMAVFEELVRPRIAAIETQAIAHRAGAAVVRQAITADGLAMERPDAEEEHIRQLYRAWKARNPRRGLHFLTQYLQLLWPGKWEVNQLWHASDVQYPQGTTRMAREGYYLTSRVSVAVEVDDPTGEELLKLRGSFRSVLAARLVILMALLRRMHNTRASGAPLRLGCQAKFTAVHGAASVYAACRGSVRHAPARDFAFLIHGNSQSEGVTDAAGKVAVATTGSVGIVDAPGAGWFGGKAIRLPGDGEINIPFSGVVDLFGVQQSQLFGFFQFDHAGDIPLISQVKLPAGAGGGMMMTSGNGNVVSYWTADIGGGFSAGGISPSRLVAGVRQWLCIEIIGDTLSWYVDGVLSTSVLINKISANGQALGIGGLNSFWPHVKAEGYCQEVGMLSVIDPSMRNPPSAPLSV